MNLYDLQINFYTRIDTMTATYAINYKLCTHLFFAKNRNRKIY